jgi:hypothetical protein
MSKRVKLTDGAQRLESPLPAPIPQTYNRDKLNLKPMPKVDKADAELSLQMVMAVKNGYSTMSEWERIVSKRNNNPQKQVTFTRDDMESSSSSEVFDSDEDELVPARIRWPDDADPLQFVEASPRMLEICDDLLCLKNNTRSAKDWRRHMKSLGLSAVREDHADALFRLDGEQCFLACRFESAGKKTLLAYCFIPAA